MVGMVSRDVVIDYVGRVGGEWVVRGRVRSRSRPGVWHSVEVRVGRLRGGYISVVGWCDCEAFTRGRMVCWHILHLVNVFVRNRRRIVGGFGVSVN